jgi:fatty-acyl-CoA synthase
MAGYLNHSPRAVLAADADEVTRTFHQDGWLATGDLATRDAEGFYTICGRRKEMFISGGENVFPSEIEETLLGHPSVAEVAVVGVAHEKWGEVGRAYLVIKAEHTFSEADLLAHCKGQLARYKIPKEFVVLEALPKSAAGKVLKRDLP